MLRARNEYLAKFASYQLTSEERVVRLRFSVFHVISNRQRIDRRFFGSSRSSVTARLRALLGHNQRR